MSSILPLLLWRGSRAFRIPYSTNASSKATLRLKTVKMSKSKQTKIIKSLYNENKKMFGKLLESKQEKVYNTKKLTESILKDSTRETIFVAVKQQNQGPKANEVRKFETVIVRMASLRNDDGATNTSRNGDIIGIDNEMANTSEENWIVKNSKSLKRLNRISPSKEEPQEKGFQSQVFVTVSSPAVPKTKPLAKEIREVPSLKQILTSLDECQDINHFGELKQIQKDGPIKVKQTSDTNLLSLINNYEEDVIDEDERLLQMSEPASSEKVTAGTSSTRTNQINMDTKCSSQNPSTESYLQSSFVSDESMLSAGYKLFPWDNPGRLSTYNPDLINSGQIISHPFPTGEKYSILQSTQYPSVTRILTATMSPEQVEILKRWEQKMKKELGEDGFRKYKEELFRNGKLLHSNLQFLLSGKSADELEILPPIQGHWKSLQSVLTKIQDVTVLESCVTHPELCYSGIVDCVAKYQDKLVLIDWKTSEKPKPFISNTYDTPVQVAAYIGAINYDPSYTIKVTEGLAVIAYKNGNDCQIFHLNATLLSKYWGLWLRRLKLYQTRNVNGNNNS